MHICGPHMNTVLTWKSCAVVTWSETTVDGDWVWCFFSWACINSCSCPKLSWLVLVKYRHQSTVNSYLFLNCRSLGYFCSRFSKLPLLHWVMVANQIIRLVVTDLNKFFCFILSSEWNKPVLFCTKVEQNQSWNQAWCLTVLVLAATSLF